MVFPENQRAEGDQAFSGVEGGVNKQRARLDVLLPWGKKRRRLGDRLRVAPWRAIVACWDLGPELLGPLDAALPVGVRAKR